MSFRCEECDKSQEAGKTPNVVVVETRERKYNNRGSFSLGSEIVKEKKLCDDCVPETSDEIRRVFEHDVCVALKCALCGVDASDGDYCDCDCEECEGKGWVWDSEDRWNNATQSHYTKDTKEECGACDGTSKRRWNQQKEMDDEQR